MNVTSNFNLFIKNDVKIWIFFLHFHVSFLYSSKYLLYIYIIGIQYEYISKIKWCTQTYFLKFLFFPFIFIYFFYFYLFLALPVENSYTMKDSRVLLYCGFEYTLQKNVNGVSTWKCRETLSENCRSKLKIKEDQIFRQPTVHCHSRPVTRHLFTYEKMFGPNIVNITKD